MNPSTCSLKNHITRVNGGENQCVKCVVRSFEQNKYWKDMKIECITYHCNIIVQMKSCFIWGQNIFTNGSWVTIWPGLLTSFHLVFTLPSLGQHTFWVFNITLSGPVLSIVFVYYPINVKFVCLLSIILWISTHNSFWLCITRRRAATAAATILYKTG